MSKVNIAEKFAKIHDFYQPRIAAELNGQQVKLVKFDRPFVFHHHENEDEMFLVVKGRFRMEFRDGTSGLKLANSSWCRAESSTVRWPSRNAGLCYSSQLRL